MYPAVMNFPSVMHRVVYTAALVAAVTLCAVAGSKVPPGGLADPAFSPLARR